MKHDIEYIRRGAHQIGVLCMAAAIVDSSIGTGEWLSAVSLGVTGLILLWTSALRKSK